MVKCFRNKCRLIHSFAGCFPSVFLKAINIFMCVVNLQGHWSMQCFSKPFNQGVILLGKECYIRCILNDHTFIFLGPLTPSVSTLKTSQWRFGDVLLQGMVNSIHFFLNWVPIFGYTACGDLECTTCSYGDLLIRLPASLLLL